MKPKKEQRPGNSIQEARAQASILNKGEILLMARVLLILYPVDSTEYFKNIRCLIKLGSVGEEERVPR